MGSFLEKYNAIEWDIVADEILELLKVFEKLIKAEKFELSQKERVKCLNIIKKLKKDFVE